MLLGLMVVGGFLLLVAAARLGYLNRDSELLRSNLTTAAIIAVAGLLATLWFSLKAPEPRQHRFTVTFVVESETRHPLSRERYPNLWYYAAPDARSPVFVDIEPFVKGLREKDELPSPGTVQTAYLDVLVAFVTDELARCFASSWDVDIVTDKTMAVTTTRTSPRKPLAPGLKVQRSELVAHLSAKEALVAQVSPGWTEFVVPPDNRIEWHEDQFSRVLRMSNPFVTLSVEIERLWPDKGSGVLTKLLAGTSTKESEKAHMVIPFAMQLQASFERLRSGHPEMPRYTHWVDTFFSRLRAFDAEPTMAELEEVNVVLRGLEVWHQRERPPGRVEPSPPSR